MSLTSHELTGVFFSMLARVLAPGSPLSPRLDVSGASFSHLGWVGTAPILPGPAISVL